MRSIDRYGERQTIGEEDTRSGKVLQRKGAVGRKGGREEHRMDWAGLGVLGDGSMMACGGSGDGILFENVCMYVK